MSEDTTYTIESDYFRTARVTDIELSHSAKGLTRIVLRADLLNNPKSRNLTVRATIVHQKRQSISEPWTDITGPTLLNTTIGNVSKFQLDSVETWKLFQHLCDLYDIGRAGIRPGRVVVELHNQDEVIRTDRSRAEIIRKLLQANHGGEVWNLLVQLQPDLADELSRALRYQQRAEAVKEFELAIGERRGEDTFWKPFLRQHSWMFGGSNVAIVDESRIDIKDTADIPFKVDGGFMDVVELKRPDFAFWAHDSRGRPVLYRDKYLIPDQELRGAIAQTEGYILQAEKHGEDVPTVVGIG